VDVSDGTDAIGLFLRVRFALPSGCYATVALEEITKRRPRPLTEDIPSE